MAATQLSDFQGFLSPQESAPIFDDAERVSAYQRLFRRVPLGASGQAIPIVTTKPTASWVGEGERKPTTNMGLGRLTMEPKKLAAISVMSAEVVRANPGGINGLIRPALAGAFATAFDYAVGYGLGGDGTGSSPFDKSLSDTTKSVALGSTPQANGGVHGDVVAVLQTLVTDGKKLTGFALDDSVEPRFWGAVDTTGNPLYVDLPQDAASLAVEGASRPGRLLNRPSFMGDGVGNGTTVGFGGDFTKGAWGAVGGISYRVSTETAVTIDGTLTSLWEHNLVAVLAEAEYGFVLADEESFVEITDGAPAGE